MGLLTLLTIQSLPVCRCTIQHCFYYRSACTLSTISLVSMCGTWLLVALTQLGWASGWVTSTSATTSTASTRFPKKSMSSVGLFRPPDCIDYQQRYIPASRPLTTFSVDTFAYCWDYCALTKDCTLFSFNLHTGTCSLFLHARVTVVSPVTLPVTLDSMNTIMGFMDCMRTVETVAKLFNSPGVMIEKTIESSQMCLSATNEKEGRFDNPDTFKIEWLQCWKANSWTFTKHGGNKDLDLVRVCPSNDSALSLEFIKDPFTSMRLSATNDTESQIQKLFKDSTPFHFTLREQVKNRNLYTEPIDARSLTSFKVTRVSHTRTCPVDRYTVTNSSLLSIGDVPYFLHGMRVTIACNPGYQVANLDNFTTIQVVTCSEDHATVKPCVPNRMNRHTKLGIVTPYLYATFLLSVTVVALMSYIATLLVGRRYKERSRKETKNRTGTQK